MGQKSVTNLGLETLGISVRKVWPQETGKLVLTIKQLMASNKRNSKSFQKNLKKNPC